MTTNITNYIPNKGCIVASPTGSQRTTSLPNSTFNFKSNIDTELLSASKFSIDSCWETGNIIKIEDDLIKKIEYNGNILYSTTLSTPECLSISQKQFPLPSNANSFSDENGCWVVDSALKKLIFFDSQLNEIGSITNLSNPVRVISSDYDGGCFVFDDGLSIVFKVNANLDVLGYHDYTALFSVTSAKHIKSMFCDEVGNLWLLIDDTITKFTYDGGDFLTKTIIDPISPLGYSSIVSDMDVDRGSNQVFVIGGCYGQSWISKYNTSGDLLLLKKNLSLQYPSRVKVLQSNSLSSFSDTVVYLVTESNENLVPYFCDLSSSSSSSSSSSEGI
jgi:hypothetical protein